MFGAILGDIVGSPYELACNNHKSKQFPLFSPESRYTDDSVMTLAVAKGFLDVGRSASEQVQKESIVHAMQQLGREHSRAGYGTLFQRWLHEVRPQPYNSLGNGSAMRVSSAAWLFDALEEVENAARISAEVTHNHPEGIKGAQATAVAIFLARIGCSKEEIRNQITSRFGYDLTRTCDEIRPTYRHVQTCMETVPEAITAFLDGDDFEDVLRTAVSLGGDSDTIAAIAGSIAEAFYGVPDWLKQECFRRLPKDLRAVLLEFWYVVEEKQNCAKEGASW